MPTINKKLTIFAILIVILLLIVLSALFIPLLILKSFVTRSEFTNPKIEYTITKFDLFKPKVTTLLPLEDGTIYASVSDFERYIIITPLKKKHVQKNPFTVHYIFRKIFNFKSVYL